MWARYFRLEAIASAFPSARNAPRRFVSVPPSVTRFAPVPSGPDEPDLLVHPAAGSDRVGDPRPVGRPRGEADGVFEGRELAGRAARGRDDPELGEPRSIRDVDDLPPVGGEARRAGRADLHVRRDVRAGRGGGRPREREAPAPRQSSRRRPRGRRRTGGTGVVCLENLIGAIVQQRPRLRRATSSGAARRAPAGTLPGAPRRPRAGGRAPSRSCRASSRQGRSPGSRSIVFGAGLPRRRGAPPRSVPPPCGGWRRGRAAPARGASFPARPTRRTVRSAKGDGRTSAARRRRSGVDLQRLPEDLLRLRDVLLVGASVTWARTARAYGFAGSSSSALRAASPRARERPRPGPRKPRVGEDVPRGRRPGPRLRVRRVPVERLAEELERLLDLGVGPLRQPVATQPEEYRPPAPGRRLRELLVVLAAEAEPERADDFAGDLRLESGNPAAGPLKVSPQSCRPSAASTSAALTESVSPRLRTVPVTTPPTPSSRPTASGSAAPRKRATKLIAITRRFGARASVWIRLSARPSER